MCTVLNIKEEDVFLMVLCGYLSAPSKDCHSATDLTLMAVDVTKEIMSVVNKMSKSSEKDSD